MTKCCFETLKIKNGISQTRAFIDIVKEIWANLTFITANKKRANNNF